MADSDGKVRIIIDTNAEQAAKELNNVGNAFQKNAETIKKSSTVYSGYEKAVSDNIQVLRELALGGNQNTEGFKKLAEETRNYKKAMQEANSIVSKATGDLDKQNTPLSMLTSKLKGLVGAYLGLRGIQAVVSYSMQAAEAFRTQERAVASLNNTLANAGIYSQQYSNHIQELARTIQSYSNYGDEVIIKAQALGQAYIGQTKITDQLTKATVDFAAATGMDLEQAFTLVGKSIGSSNNALARYGIELNKNMTDSEKMTAIAIQLGNRYEGQAKQMANASIQLKNAVGDLSETFGAVLNPTIQSVQKTFISLTHTIDGALQKVVNFRNKFYQKALELRKAQLETVTNPKDLATIKSEIKRYENIISSSQVNKTPNIVNKKPVKISDEIGGASGGSSGAVKQAQHIKDSYEKMQDAVNNARRAVQNAAIEYGTSSSQVQAAFAKYKQVNEQLASVDDLFKTTETKTKFQELQQQITETTTKLQELYLTGQSGSEEFKTTKNNLVQLQTQLKDVNTAITSNAGVDWKNLSDSIRSNLSSAILTPLQQGESAFSRLGQIGLNVVQMIGQEIINNLLKQITLEKTLQAIKAVGKSFGGFFSGLFGSADGNVFKNGRIQPFANGGIVNKPTLFPMANGTGLMGEAGPEAIMPLTRKNGKLGVEGSGVTVNIINQSQSQIETRQRDNGSFDVIVKRVNQALMNERTSEGFSYAQQRASSRGITAA